MDAPAFVIDFSQFGLIVDFSLPNEIFTFEVDLRPKVVPVDTLFFTEANFPFENLVLTDFFQCVAALPFVKRILTLAKTRTFVFRNSRVRHLVSIFVVGHHLTADFLLSLFGVILHLRYRHFSYRIHFLEVDPSMLNY